MSNINIQAITYLDENSKTIINDKLKSYKLDKEVNYAVVVLKILVTNSESKNSNELYIKIVPKVHYVVPFITKKLAEEYIKELSTENKLLMFLTVNNGQIIVKGEDINSFINNFEDLSINKNIEYDKMSLLSTYNILAFNWQYSSEQDKERLAFEMGGLKNCKYIKEIFDNWKFNPEFEKEAKKYIK